MTNYIEANQKAMEEYKNIKVGDCIIAKGIKATIAEIYYCEVFAETGHPIFKEAKDEKTYYLFYDIEFKDTYGVYRHWKSHWDGGKLYHQ